MKLSVTEDIFKHQWSPGSMLCGARTLRQLRTKLLWFAQYHSKGRIYRQPLWNPDTKNHHAHGLLACMLPAIGCFLGHRNRSHPVCSHCPWPLFLPQYRLFICVWVDFAASCGSSFLSWNDPIINGHCRLLQPPVCLCFRQFMPLCTHGLTPRHVPTALRCLPPWSRVSWSIVLESTCCLLETLQVCQLLVISNTNHLLLWLLPLNTKQAYVMCVDSATLFYRCPFCRARAMSGIIDWIQTSNFRKWEIPVCARGDHVGKGTHSTTRQRLCSRETQALTKGKGLSMVHMVHSHISADTKAGQIQGMNHKRTGDCWQLSAEHFEPLLDNIQTWQIK